MNNLSKFRNTLTQDIDIGDVVFGWIRLYWNGLVNGYKNWSKSYVIGNWCKLYKFDISQVENRNNTLTYQNFDL